MFLISLVAGLALADAPQAAGPSFDCARATTLAEQTICADPALARLDRRMAERYAAVRRALPSAARPALTRDQRWFLGARDEWRENSERVGFRDFAGMAERMSDRIEFLDSLDPRPVRGLTGVWRNLAGSAEVRAAGEGRLRVSISAAHPVNARWLCEVSGTGRVVDGVLTVAADDAPGWRLRVTLQSGVLTVEELAPAGESEMRPYCGANGHVDGGYFRTR